MPSFKIYFIEFFDERNIFNTKNYANIGREITRSSFSKTFNKSFHLSHLSLIFDVVKVKQN